MAIGKDKWIAWREAVRSHSPSVAVTKENITFSFASDADAAAVTGLMDSLGIAYSKPKDGSIQIKRQWEDVLLFSDLDGALDRLSNKISLLDSQDIFILELSADYIWYSHDQRLSESGNIRSKDILGHFKQYTKLLQLYDSSESALFEAKKSTANAELFVVVSKGEEKHFTLISYKPVDHRVFSFDFEVLQLDDFTQKLSNPEWLACFNNNICRFMELQSEPNRSFANLYGNFNYLIEQADLNYRLFVDKFSFNNIRQQYRTEKEGYFVSLDAAQEKISGQIISVPLSLGASIFGFYSFEGSKTLLWVIYASIVVYCLFIAAAVWMSILDIDRLAKDVNLEEANFKRHYLDVYERLKDDFLQMLSKRRRIRFLGYAMLAALLLTVILSAVFLIFQHDGDSRDNIFRFASDRAVAFVF